MKNHYRFLGLALLVPVLAIANFNEEPVPVQSFQQAQSTAPETTDVPKNAVKAPENGPEGITGIEDLKAELNQLNQNDLQFEQKTNDKLNDLLNKNELIQQKLNQLYHELSILNQEVNRLKESSRSENNMSSFIAAVSGKVHHGLQLIQQELGSAVYPISISIIAVTVSLLIWTLRSSTRKSKPEEALSQPESSLEQTEDEYDYMGSTESIPAKLNLARTYIAMDDHKSAREVLSNVLKLGNRSQRQEAEELWKALSPEL